MQPHEIPEGTFTGTGMNLAVGGFEPRPATTHIATTAAPRVDPPRPPWWRRLLAWLGLTDE